VAEVISERAMACRLMRLGVRKTPSCLTGCREYLLKEHGLDPFFIAARLKTELVHCL
jgi:hypothetical protein